MTELKYYPDVTYELLDRQQKNSLKSKKGDILICKCCTIKYERGALNFYDICDICFSAFHTQKLVGRILNSKHFEDIETFIVSNVCAHISIKQMEEQMK